MAAGRLCMDMGAHAMRFGAAGVEGACMHTEPTHVVVGDDGYARVGPAVDAMLEGGAGGVAEVVWPAGAGWVGDGDEACVEKLWAHAWERVGWDSTARDWVLAAPHDLPVAGVERAAELVFECFESPAAGWIAAAEAALFAGGATDGVVVDVGDAATRVVPVAGGRAVRYAAVATPAAGSLVTRLWDKWLDNEGHAARLPSVLSGLRRCAVAVKHRFSLCAASAREARDVARAGDLTAGQTPNNAVAFPLPDGQTLSIPVPATHGLLAGEALFRPREAHGVAALGVHEALHAALQQLPVRQPAPRVHVCGGSAALEGFPDRLRREVEYTMPGPQRPSLHFAAHPAACAWRGAALAAALPEFAAALTTRAEYYEGGARVAYRKCFG